VVEALAHEDGAGRTLAGELVGGPDLGRSFVAGDDVEADLALEEPGGGLGEEVELSQAVLDGPADEAAGEGQAEAAAALVGRHREGSQQADVAVDLDAAAAAEAAGVVHHEKVRAVEAPPLRREAFGPQQVAEQREVVRQGRADARAFALSGAELPQRILP